MQAVVLAGGLGTRLYPLTHDIPKAMVPVLGKPFVEHLIALLSAGGVDEFVFCVGHLARAIEDCLGDGSRFGVKIRYSDEGKTLLDTAGAIRHALPLLAEEFFVTFGDSYLVLPYRKIWEDFVASEREALMVVYRNDNKFDSSDVFVGDGLVKAYRKSPPLEGAHFINDGLMALRRASLAAIEPGRRMSLQEFFQPTIARGQLAAWETTQRFYEIGSHSGLKELEERLRVGGLSQ
jgi:NDP-sugar pyrophosphorylase family protein